MVDGTCIGLGDYFDQASQTRGIAADVLASDGVQATTALPMPPDADLGADAPAGPWIGDLACDLQQTCVGVGFYADKTGATAGLIETLANGAWTATRAPEPDGFSDGFVLDGVGCEAAGACVAVGGMGDAGATLALVDGVWTASAAPGRPLDVACWSAACVAVGDEVSLDADQNRHTTALIGPVTASGWSATVQSPPVDATPAQAAAAPILLRVSCIPSGRCAAWGWYGSTDPDSSFTFLVTGQDGVWDAAVPLALPGPGGLNSVSFRDTACSDTRCVASGNYLPSGSGPSEGFVDAAGSSGWISTSVGSSLLRDVACRSDDLCYAIGYRTTGETLVVPIMGGVAGSPTVLPVPSGGRTGANGWLQAVGCGATSCAAADWVTGTDNWTRSTLVPLGPTS